MKNTTVIILSLFVIVTIYLLTRTAKKTVTAVKETIKSMTRGYKNNNFGNIRITRDKNGKQTFWKGEIIGTDKAFKTFSSPAYGYRAIFALLKEYIGKGYNTIEKIITRYAPSSENNTNAYISTVVKRSGVAKDAYIAASDLVTLSKIVSAISFVENGIPANEVDIENGKKLLS